MNQEKINIPAIVKTEYKEISNETFFEIEGNKNEILLFSLSIVRALYDEFDFDIDVYCSLAKKICAETKEDK